MEQAQYNIRARIGKLSGAVGIICNCLLAAGKLIVGHMTSSMSITADGLNNLSDGASSIVTLLGFKLAEKPADRKHPYGHARIEYIAGLTVAVMILFIGLELGKSSVEKLIDPEPIEFSFTAVWVLFASILVKLFMMLFNLKMGRRINSNALLATAADSRNDVISTAAVLAAAVISRVSGVQVDGWAGLVVALFILWSGVGIAKDTIDPLLGRAPDEQLVHTIANEIRGYDARVLGIHDLMVHDYGPGRRFASVHVELDAREDVLAAHELIDSIERDVKKKLRIELVIHYDPIVTDDQELTEMRARVETVIHTIDDRLSLHDFRMVRGVEHSNLIFDLVIPWDMRGREAELKRRIDEQLSSDGRRYHAVITFDTQAFNDPHVTEQ